MEPVFGVGTHLKRILGRMGIHPEPGCPCELRAQTMDANGVEWCEQNVDLIVDWLEEEAKNRGLPFLRLTGKILVWWAIRAEKRQNPPR